MYHIADRSTQNWHPVKAKSITGAKRIATATYQAAVDSRMEVAWYDEKRGCFTRVAVKYGYAKWVNL